MIEETIPTTVSTSPQETQPPSFPTNSVTDFPSQEQKKNTKYLLFFFLVVGFMLLLIFLSPWFLRNTNTSQEKIMREKPVIKLAVNPWKASELNAAIAKIILEEKMGFLVELVPVDENAQWQSLASGDIHASLEIWPSGHRENIQNYIENSKTVENGGNLGPVGKIGWFIPKYLQDEYPELGNWEGFKDPQNVALFATNRGGKGQFFTGDPTWTQYDEQIINNLELNFEVNVLGSEEALIQEVDKAYKNKKPIIFYFWTPHWAHSIYELSPVKLPDYTDECYLNIKGGVNCDYPSDQLLKVFWSGFKDYAPEAHKFLRKFNYTNQDQIGMLAAVQLNKKEVEEVARTWITNNESVWMPWIQ